MRLELTGRHVDITPSLRRLVEAKIGKLERVLNDSAVSAQAVLTVGRGAPSRVRMPRIVRTSRQTIKPMTVSDAAKEMDIAREGIVVFRDPSTEAVNVLYRRPNGELA